VSAERLDVHPTRQVLLALKRRKTLAEGIADILAKDLEVLMKSLIEYRERASILQTQLYAVLGRSYDKFIEAEMLIGHLKVKEFALTAASIDFNIEQSETIGVLGIQFPSLKHIKQEPIQLVKEEKVERDIETPTDTGDIEIQFPLQKAITQEYKPRLSLSDTPIQLEEASSMIIEVMDALVELASITAAIRELLEVILLKRRQINRIRFKIVPQLDLTIEYIEHILEEIEHQDAIRVRVLQRKRKERSEIFYET